MQSNFDQLEPKEKMLFIEKLLCYTLPKMKTVDFIENDIKDSKPPIFVFRDLSKTNDEIDR